VYIVIRIASTANDFKLFSFLYANYKCAKKINCFIIFFKIKLQYCKKIRTFFCHIVGTSFK